MYRFLTLLVVIIFVSCSEKNKFDYTDLNIGDAIESFYLNDSIILERHDLYKLDDDDPFLKLYGGNRIVYVIGRGKYSNDQMPHLKITNELITNVNEINIFNDIIYGTGYKPNEIEGNFKLLTDIYGKGQKVCFLINKSDHCQYFITKDELKRYLKKEELFLESVDSMIDDLRKKRGEYKSDG